LNPVFFAKIGRACELWNEGEKTLAHIHLAHAGLPPCDDEHALRLFFADELLDNDAPPDLLLNALGLDPSTLAVHKYPGQPRILAGHGRESGRYTYGRVNVTPAALRDSKERRGQPGRKLISFRSSLDWR
jgi:hypothetical protein